MIPRNPDSISLSVRFLDFSKKHVKNASDGFRHCFTVRGKKSGSVSSAFKTMEEEEEVDMNVAVICCFLGLAIVSSFDGGLYVEYC